MRSHCLPGVLMLCVASVVFATPAPEIVQREAYDVHVRTAGPAALSQLVWSWTTCADGVAEQGNRSDIDSADPATGRLLARDGRLDVDVDLPSAVGVRRYAAKAVTVPSDDAVLARSAGGGEPARVAIRRAAPRIRIKLTDVPVREIAQQLARGAGIRIDGSEHLSEEPIILNFQCIEPWAIVKILADVSGLTPLRGGRTHFGFSTTAEHGELQTLHAAWQAARDGGDLDAEAKTLQPLLKMLDAAAGKLVIGDTSFWGEAARLANQRDQLAEGERALRAQLAQIERSNGDRDGVEYGETLFLLGQQRQMQDDEAAAVALYDQAIATVERARGPIHPDLARMLSRRGALHYLGNDPEAAIPMLRRGIASYGDVVSDNTGVYGAMMAMESLAYALQMQRQHDDARPVLVRYAALASAVDGPDAGSALHAIEALSDVEISTDHLATARPLLQRLAANAGASDRLRDAARHRLAAIELLGPFADAAVSIDDARLRALRQRVAAAGPGPAADEARRMLDLRARRFLGSGDSTAQQRACQLAAEVEAGRAASTDPQRLATIRDALVSGCMSQPMSPL